MSELMDYGNARTVKHALDPIFRYCKKNDLPRCRHLPSAVLDVNPRSPGCRPPRASTRHQPSSLRSRRSRLTQLIIGTPHPPAHLSPPACRVRTVSRCRTWLRYSQYLVSFRKTPADSRPLPVHRSPRRIARASPPGVWLTSILPGPSPTFLWVCRLPLGM